MCISRYLQIMNEQKGWPVILIFIAFACVSAVLHRICFIKENHRNELKTLQTYLWSCKKDRWMLTPVGQSTGWEVLINQEQKDWETICRGTRKQDSKVWRRRKKMNDYFEDQRDCIYTSHREYLLTCPIFASDYFFHTEPSIFFILPWTHVAITLACIAHYIKWN